jgi:hypothetical protein
MDIKFLLLIFCIGIISFSACQKNNDAPTVTTSPDSLNVVNASNDTVNFYLNGTRLNNNSNLYPGGSSGYYPVPAGQQNYQIKKQFNPATSAVQTLFSIPLNLTPNQYYSLFVAGATSADAFTTIDTLQADTTSGTCYVRFVNASPNAGTVSFSIGGVNYSNQGFKSASGFKLVDTSSLSPIMLYQSGSPTPVISGFYPLLQGESYTFYTKGTPGGTGNSAYSIGVTINYN